MRKTVTSVYFIRKIKGSPDESDGDVPSTLEEQLGTIPYYASFKENRSPINHSANYISGSKDGLRDAVIITNVDLISDNERGNKVKDFYLNALIEQMERYQSGSCENISRVARIISEEQKLNDHQLMEMCGLLPRE